MCLQNHLQMRNTKLLQGRQDYKTLATCKVEALEIEESCL